MRFNKIAFLVSAQFIFFGSATSFDLHAQAIEPSSPVIDVHWHFPGQKDLEPTIEQMKQLNVKFAVLIGTSSQLQAAETANKGLILPSLTFPCENGKLANIGVQCFEDNSVFPSIPSLRDQIRNGKLKALGEINAQYLGISPDDPRLEPIFSLAEAMDIPVGIHMGIGPPGVAYEGPRFPPVKSHFYRGAAGNPLLLEDVLIRHPKLRLYVMHAAYPFREEMTYMLYMHPQLYVDLSVLQWAIPRPAYLSYLRSLVEAGFGKRLMFGSDGNTTRLKEGIDAIRNADFLTTEQKSDILYNNAFVFFRLSSDTK